MPDIGSAPNKTFQRTDGTRTGTEVWQEAQTATVGIESDDHDTHDQDIATAISNRLMLDGGNQPSAAIPWNSQRITGLGTPTARTDAQRVDKVQDSAHTYAGTSSGTDTITATLSPAITAYAAGQRFTFLAGGTNTGPATLNLNTVGAKDLKKGAAGSTALDAGDITAGGVYDVEYDGTNFQLLNPSTFRIAGTILIDGTAAAAAGITLAEDTDNGTNTVTLRAPASIASNVTFTLPSADGTVGQSLVTNGSAALSFSNVCPIGSILMWAASTPPTGWLECDGSAVSRSTYATLFGLISDDYGAGNGTTTFNLPDLRGRFVRGWDHGAGTDPNAASRTDRGDGTTGDNVGTKQADEFKLHGHPFRLSENAGNDSEVSGGLMVSLNNQTNHPEFTGTPAGTAGQQIGGSGGSETRPVNINMMYIIRAL